MTLQLLPIPVEHVKSLRVYWGPFVDQVADRGLQTSEEIAADAMAGRIILALAWDAQNVSAKAMAGVEILKDARGRLWCHLIYCTGHDLPQWFDLVDEIERWAKDHLGCSAMRATCRSGWVRPLKGKGYRETHRVVEKELT